MKRRMSMPLVSLFALAGVAAVFADPLLGQSLHLAELFVEQGRLDDARAEVGAWFEIRGDAATPEEVQHGLWLQGRLLEDRTAARQALERLVSSDPEGPYTALALTWLADAAAEEGNESAAMAYQARVVREFPESNAAATARDWLDARGVSVEPPAPRPLAAEVRDSGAASPARLPARADTADVQGAIVATADSVRLDSLREDSASAAERLVPPAVGTDTAAMELSALPVDTMAADTASIAVAEATVDTTPADTTPTQADTTPVVVTPEPARAEPVSAPPSETQEAETPVPVAASGDPVAGAAEGGAYAVQIGAFRNGDGAAGLVAELIANGYEARLVGVPDSSLFRVRIGRYATLDQAGTELARVREAGYDGAVVNDARRELAISR